MESGSISTIFSYPVQLKSVCFVFELVCTSVSHEVLYESILVDLCGVSDGTGVLVEDIIPSNSFTTYAQPAHLAGSRRH